MQRAFTCLKPATFAGVKYMPGDTVPAEAIPAGRVTAVIRMGIIAEHSEAAPGTPEEAAAAIAAAEKQLAEAAQREQELREALEAAKAAQEGSSEPRAPRDGAPEPCPIVIPLTRDGGVFEAATTMEGLLQVTNVLQMNVENAQKAIADVTDDMVLALIHGLDSRKGVQAAAEKRAQALEDNKEAG